MKKENSPYISCSGNYYPYRKNRFYPAGFNPGTGLNIIDTVELNGTFYRTPKLTDLKKYTENTELEKIINQFPKTAKQHSIYFNNTYYEAGYKNALALKELIKNKDHA